MKKIITTILITMIFILAGCGAKDKPISDVPSAEDKGTAEATDPAADLQSKPASKESENGEENRQQESGTSISASVKETAVIKKTGMSLAKRLCGKYSYHYGSGDLSDNEYLIMNVLSFGDNLYAFCGNAIPDPDDEGDLGAYSFWATEFIPFEADDMRDTMADEVKVNALCFSVMSNAGKYWNSGCEGSIKLTDEGLLFEGFQGEDFLCPEHDSRLFLKDERVEDVFPYIKGKNNEGSLEGMWALSDGNESIYLDFKGGDLYIYHKSGDEEVYLAAGACDFSEGSFTCNMSVLGNGGMPCEISADYGFEGDELRIRFDSDAPSFLLDNHIFRHIDESDVHVMTMDEVVFNNDSFGSFGGDSKTDKAADFDFGGEYYGVFVSSAKEESACNDDLIKLMDDGFDASVLYTPDFSKLNPQPYYVVTAGMFDTEEKADICLDKVKNTGYKDAYVKCAGNYTGGRVSYTMYGTDGVKIQAGRIMLCDVAVSLPFNTETEPQTMDLYIDEKTEFDKSSDISGFGNYKKGDTPYDWFLRNYDLMKNDTDAYMANGPALVGIFEVSLDGSHIKAYHGSYWWD